MEISHLINQLYRLLLGVYEVINLSSYHSNIKNVILLSLYVFNFFTPKQLEYFFMKLGLEVTDTLDIHGTFSREKHRGNLVEK